MSEAGLYSFHYPEIPKDGRGTTKYEGGYRPDFNWWTFHLRGISYASEMFPDNSSGYSRWPVNVVVLILTVGS